MTKGKSHKKFMTALCAVLMALTMLIGSTASVSAATITVSLTRGSLIWYDGNRANTYRKYVSWKSGGKTYKRDAYCLEPKLSAPPSKKYSASQLGNTNDVAQCLYFANGAPGEEAFVQAMKSKGLYSKYMGNSSQYYAFMHVILAYAYEGSRAWKIFGGGSLSSGYQSAVKSAYKWCVAQDISQNAGFKVSRTIDGTARTTLKATFDAAEGKFVTKDFHVSGASGQSFSYTVPKNATLYYKKSSTATKYTSVAAGKKVTLKHGYYFHFKLAAKAQKGFTSKVTGKLSSMDAYKMATTSGAQHLAFFGLTSKETATFKVTLTPLAYGKVSIKKVYKEFGESATTPEENAVFKVYNASFNSYDEAAAANTDATPYTATLTTGSGGTAISRKLILSSSKGKVYKVEQVGGRTGYKLAPAATVTLVKDETTQIEQSGSATIVNEGYPFNLEVTKVDEGTGETIVATGSNAAQFTVYSDKDCTNAIGTITCDGGTGRLANNVAPGTYYIKETKAPTYNGKNYVVDSTVREVVLSAANCEMEGTGTDSVYVGKIEISNKLKSNHNLVIAKQIDGDISDNKSFDYTLELRGLAPNREYVMYQVNSNDPATSALWNASQVSYEAMLAGDDEVDNSDDCFKSGTATDDTRLLSCVANANGEATVHFSMKTQGIARIENLPETAQYRITEAGSSQGDIKITPSFKATAPNGTVNLSSSTGNPGESLSTRWESFPTASEGNPSYPVGFMFTNDGNIRHKLIIKKEVDGVGADRTKAFPFSLSLILPATDSYTVPAYSIVEEDVNGNMVTVQAVDAVHMPNENGTTTVTQKIDFKLKAGQQIVMTGLNNGTQISSLDETPSTNTSITAVFYQYPTSSSEKGEPKQTVYKSHMVVDQNNLFTDLKCLFSGKDVAINNTTATTTEIDVTNSFKEQVKTNRLELEKVANGANPDETFEFDVTIGADAAAKHTNYYSVSEGGYRNYYLIKEADKETGQKFTISADGGVIRVKDEAGNTLKDFPVTVTRDDGEVTTLITPFDPAAFYIDSHSSNMNIGAWFALSETQATTPEITPVVSWLDVETTLQASRTSAYNLAIASGTATTTEKYYDIQCIPADGQLHTVKLKAGEKAYIEGLYPETTYKITEKESEYDPSYVVTRKAGSQSGTRTLATGKGEAGTPLSIPNEQFPAVKSGGYTDTVVFTNKKTTEDLEVSKTVSDMDTSKQFGYTVELYGASKDGTGSYKALVPGDKTLDVFISSSGDIEIRELTGQSIDLSGIPVKIKRQDGEEISLKTDQDGKILVDAYYDWLLEGLDPSIREFDFTVIAIGKEIVMTFTK